MNSISAVEIREFLEKEAPDRRHAWENTNLTALRKECARVMVERATRNKKAKQKDLLRRHDESKTGDRMARKKDLLMSQLGDGGGNDRPGR